MCFMYYYVSWIYWGDFIVFAQGISSSHVFLVSGQYAAGNDEKTPH